MNTTFEKQQKQVKSLTWQYWSLHTATWRVHFIQLDGLFWGDAESKELRKMFMSETVRENYVFLWVSACLCFLFCCCLSMFRLLLMVNTFSWRCWASKAKYFTPMVVCIESIKLTDKPNKSKKECNMRQEQITSKLFCFLFFVFLWAPLRCPSGEKRSRPMASSGKPLGERQLAIPPEIKIYTPERDARGYEWPSRFRPPWSQSPPARHSPGLQANWFLPEHLNPSALCTNNVPANVQFIICMGI